MDISTYLLSIVGVAILGVIVDLILPSGTVSKYIKGVFALILIFVIISPIPKLINQNWSFNDIFQTSSTEIDEDYLEDIKNQQIDKLNTDIKNLLVDNGFNNVDILVELDNSNFPLKIKYIFVDLTNLVLNQNMQHINYYTAITKLLCEQCNVKEEQIVFNGW